MFCSFFPSFAEILQNRLVFSCLNNHLGLLTEIFSHTLLIKRWSNFINNLIAYCLNLSSLMSSPKFPLWKNMTLHGMTGSLFSTLRRAVMSRQHLDIRFRALSVWGIEGWEWMVGISRDSSRAPFLLPRKRRVNIKYSWNNFVWMEAGSHTKLLLTHTGHIGGNVVMTCIRKERYYSHKQLLIIENSSVMNTWEKQIWRHFSHHTKSRAPFI